MTNLPRTRESQPAFEGLLHALQHHDDIQRDLLLAQFVIQAHDRRLGLSPRFPACSQAGEGQECAKRPPP